MITNTEKINTKIVPILEKVIKIITNLYRDKLFDILLYGSYSRKDEREESDIDIAIIIDDQIHPFNEIERINKEIYELCLKYNLLISIHPISKEKFLKEKHFFYKNLHEEGISLLER